jgi:hypothetical protein
MINSVPGMLLESSDSRNLAARAASLDAESFQERLGDNRFLKRFLLVSRKADFLYYRRVNRSGAQHIHPHAARG